MTLPLHRVWSRFAAVTAFAKGYGRPEYFDEHEILKKVLLLRCDYHLFEWENPDDGGKSSLVDYHKDYAAYHSFWAWELLQRAKKGGGE